jgi:hypothetical protein
LICYVDIFIRTIIYLLDTFGLEKVFQSLKKAAYAIFIAKLPVFLYNDYNKGAFVAGGLYEGRN